MDKNAANLGAVYIYTHTGILLNKIVRMTSLFSYFKIRKVLRENCEFYAVFF